MTNNYDEKSLARENMKLCLLMKDASSFGSRSSGKNPVANRLDC